MNRQAPARPPSARCRARPLGKTLGDPIACKWIGLGRRWTPPFLRLPAVHSFRSRFCGSVQTCDCGSGLFQRNKGDLGEQCNFAICIHGLPYPPAFRCGTRKTRFQSYSGPTTFLLWKRVVGRIQRSKLRQRLGPAQRAPL